MGCGRHKVKNTIGIDKICWPGVDICHDLGVFPYPIKDSCFNVIYANHILEHVPDLIATMRELYRILAPNGTLLIRVPHSSCCMRWGDPTHLRFFSLLTFDHFNTKNDAYGINTNFVTIEKKIHYLLYEGIREGNKITSFPIWIAKIFDSVVNYNNITQALFERYFIYYVGGCEEVTFKLVSYKL